jgi:hypothetical protein
MPVAKIHMLEGRYGETRLAGRSRKKRLGMLKALNEWVVATAGMSPDDLLITLYETRGENISFGRGLAQRADRANAESQVPAKLDRRSVRQRMAAALSRLIGRHPANLTEVIVRTLATIAAVALALNAAVASGDEIPAYEVLGLPVTSHQLAAVGSLQGQAAFGEGSQRAIDITATGVLGNLLAPCHLVGGITKYAELPVTVLDRSGAPLGKVQAGIAQFNPGTRLQGCSLSEFHSPTNNGIVLDGSMVNFLAVHGHSFNGGSFDWTEAGSDAARLAKQYYALSDQNGMLPLTGSVTVPAIGSVGYEFTIVLVETGERLDAVVYRETVSEKFTPHMPDQDRRASGVLWTSVHSK